MINDKYQQGKNPVKSKSIFLYLILFSRMYQLEKDEGSEFGASIGHAVPSSSKMSLTPQQLVKRVFNLI
jgi:hypothetical protein